MYDKAKELMKWLLSKTRLNEIFDTNKSTLRSWHIPKWSIVTCHLGNNIGEEKNGFGRPVVVVSNNNLNIKSGNVIVVALSKNLKFVPGTTRRLKFRSHYALWRSKYPFLRFDSAVQCEDIRVISKARIGSIIGSITDPIDQQNIEKRLKYSLDL